MIREGTIQIPFRYAAGATASQFLVALRDDERILGARCPSCQRVLCPAPPYCARCGAATAELVEVGPAGTVVSFTETGDGRTFGLILLDGADTALLHRLIEPAPELRCGARVRARFAAERTGSICDIEGFTP